MSSAAVVIGTLRAKEEIGHIFEKSFACSFVCCRAVQYIVEVL